MATADPHQLTSRHIFPPSASPQPRQRPTTTTASHYRPFSQVVSDETDALEPRPPKFSRRGSVHSLLEMVHKQKSKKNGGRHQIPTHTSIGKTPTRQGFSSHNGAAVIVPDSNVIGPPKDVYVAKKSWHSYGRMKLHPYSNDAVYMQSYDPIMLENEKYDYLLLRHLTSSVPTFNTSMKKPPSNVLDLGCGQGHWLLDASDFWLNTDFTGFDLVDILLPEVRQKANIHLVRGNFVKYPLPFPDKSFDFVRMANLSFAIPHDKWSFVISETRRILRVGGLLEIIDDEVCFPYGPFPVRAGLSGHRRRNGQVSNGSKHPRVLDDRGESDASSSTLDGDEDNGLDNTSKGEWANKLRLKSPRVAGTVSRHRTVYLQQWASNYRISRDVEDSFVGMLQQRSIHLTPQELVHQLRHAFGYKNCSSPKTYDITLAAISMLEADQPGETNVDSLPDQHLNDPPEEKESRYSSGNDEDSSNPPTPPQHSAKAAGRLGISYSDLVAATTTTAAVKRRVASNIRSHRQLAIRKSSQPPGIVISPSTFIPLTPIETEFHACKWVHTLLGCKPAIADYVRSDDDQTGSQLMDGADLSDALWTYENFRRQRFHWPADPEPDPESFASPSISNACKMNVHQLFDGLEPEPVHIRTIRVYHATKTDTTSLASRFFFTHTSSPLSRR